MLRKVLFLIAAPAIAALVGCVPETPSGGSYSGPGTPDTWHSLTKGTRTPLLRQEELPVRTAEPSEIEVEPGSAVAPGTAEAPAEIARPATAQPQSSPAMPVEKLLADSTEAYVVVKGDAISKIASRCGITSGLLRRLNGMPEDHQLIHIDERLRVVRGPFKVVVDTASMQLGLYRGEKLIKTYPVGVGTEETDTPKGTFKIIDKVKNARWDYGGMHVPPGSPENPTGTRWMKIAPSYGIHGTNDPSSIGKKTSRGCIRMFNADAEELYDVVTVGAEVIVK